MYALKLIEMWSDLNTSIY